MTYFEVYSKYYWVKQVFFLRLIENLGPLVSTTRPGIVLWGRVYCPQNTLERASLSTLPTPPAERARAPALAFHGQNTREKGLAEDLNEKGQGQAQEMTC